MDFEKAIKIKDVRRKLIEPEIHFLKEMSNYLGVPIYIFGSLFRFDYFPNKSDIDISIFSDNVENTVHRLVDFLGISSSKIKIFKIKSVNKKTHKTKIIWGFKTNYRLDVEDYSYNNRKWHDLLYYPKRNKRFEIMVYSNKYTNYINNINKGHFRLPFLCTFVIFFLKSCYYYFFFSEIIYKNIKREILELSKTHKEEFSVIGTL